MPKGHNHLSNNKFQRHPKRIERFIGMITAVAALGTAAGVLAVSKGAEATEPPITERPHKEYVIKDSTERLWGISQRAFPKTDPRESSFEIAGDQPEGFDLGTMQVGDTIYLEPDAEIGKLVNPTNSAEEGQ
jgi:hypothetical protein